MKHIRHEFEPLFYFMWMWTMILVGGILYVAVQHL